CGRHQPGHAEDARDEHPGKAVVDGKGHLMRDHGKHGERRAEVGEEERPERPRAERVAHVGSAVAPRRAGRGPVAPGRAAGAPSRTPNRTRHTRTTSVPTPSAAYAARQPCAPMSHCASGPITRMPAPIPENARPIMLPRRWANHRAMSAPLGTQLTAHTPAA